MRIQIKFASGRPITVFERAAIWRGPFAGDGREKSKTNSIWLRTPSPQALLIFRATAAALRAHL
jgi:hypothetical protein